MASLGDRWNVCTSDEMLRRVAGGAHRSLASFKHELCGHRLGVIAFITSPITERFHPQKSIQPLSWTACTWTAPRLSPAQVHRRCSSPFRCHLPRGNRHPLWRRPLRAQMLSYVGGALSFHCDASRYALRTTAFLVFVGEYCLWRRVSQGCLPCEWLRVVGHGPLHLCAPASMGESPARLFRRGEYASSPSALPVVPSPPGYRFGYRPGTRESPCNSETLSSDARPCSSPLRPCRQASALPLGRPARYSSSFRRGPSLPRIAAGVRPFPLPALHFSDAETSLPFKATSTFGLTYLHDDDDSDVLLQHAPHPVLHPRSSSFSHFCPDMA
ncbi:hypothetical protein C8R43DRAFT_503972 [Mycena crocata]|nr:hypothetical protein C8R43DRAFT_503972 [Mycena crocata]